jgi:hypothetical protein
MTENLSFETYSKAKPVPNGKIAVFFIFNPEFYLTQSIIQKKIIPLPYKFLSDLIMKLFFLRSILFAVACIILSCSNDKIDDIDNIDEKIKNLFHTPKAIVNTKNDDEYFFNYRLVNFAPSTEPFIEETFGSTLMFEEIGFWEHTSYTSHVVGFTTNLPSISIVEYGETADYGKTTVQSESYFYQHLHYIKGLEQGKTYHYRYAVQGYDGVTIASGDHTFTTQEFTDDIIRIPEDMEGSAPYTLTQSNAKYVLTQDFTSPTLGINIKAHNIELDLDGHTIIYDDGTPEVPYNQYDEKSSHGIRSGLWNFTNFKILNGTVKQGRYGGKNHHAFFLYHMGNTYNEIAGITIDYYGDDCGTRISDGHIHHNVLYDRGSIINDRHGGVHAILVGEKPENNVSFNSLRRFRHCGIRSCGNIIYNELYSDSFDTNSFALSPSGDNGTKLYNNKIFGMGYNPIGTGWGNDIHVKDNFIYMHGFSPSQRSAEFVRSSAIAGMRVTAGNGINMLFEDNVIVLKPEDGCTGARGIWTFNSINNKDIIYRRNKVKVEAMPGNCKNPEDGAKVTGDLITPYYNDDVNYAISAVNFSARAENPPAGEPMPNPIIFEDNHFIGNVNLITIGEGYGICDNVWMYRTKLEKIEHDSEFFRPVRVGFWYWDTRGNRLVDTETTLSEQEMTPFFFGGTGKMEIRYGKSKTLTIKNKNGTPIANKSFTLATVPDDNYTQTLTTKGNGTVTFDLLTVRYHKWGNSQENGGVKGTREQTDYEQYIFSVDGYKPLTVSLEQLKNISELTVEN